MSQTNDATLGVPRPVWLLHADDHPMVRDAVAAHLAAEPAMRVVGAATPAEALAAACEHRPAVILLDVEFTAGEDRSHCFEFVDALLDAAPGARVLFCSGRPTEFYVLQARQLHKARPGRVAGFVSKAEGLEPIAAAVRAAAVGAGYAESPAAAATADRDPFLARLTPTQLRVLTEMAAHPDLLYKQLAPQVGRAVDTLKRHVEGIMIRTGLHEKSALIARAMRAGLTGPV